MACLTAFVPTCRGQDAVAGGGQNSTSRPGFLAAFDAESGKQRWRTESDGSGLFWVQYESRNLVYVESVSCHQERRGRRKASLVAYDARTGRKRWDVTVKGTTIQTGPIRVGSDYLSAFGKDGAVVVTQGRKGTLVGLSARTGDERWRERVEGKPVGGTADLVLLRSEQGLRAVERGSGAQLWNYSLPAGAVTSDPSITAEAVALVVAMRLPGAVGVDSVVTAIHVLDVASGAVRLEIPVPSVPSPPTFIDIVGSVVMTMDSGTGNVDAFDLLSGQRLWTAEGAATYAHHDLRSRVLVRVGAEFVVLDVQTGSPVSRIPVGDQLTAHNSIVSLTTEASTQLNVFEAATGNEIWHRRVDPYAGSLAAGRDNMYASGGCDLPT